MRKNLTTVNIMHFASISIVFTYLAPYFLLGEASHVTIFDQLDSLFVDLKVLSESGQIFSLPNTRIDNLAGGLPRASLPSGLYVPLWLTYFLGPFDAFVMNQVLLRLAAYFGMYLLLKRHVLKNDTSYAPCIFASLAFSLLPFYSVFGLSIAGQPLLLYAFLNIRQGKSYCSWKDWLIVILMPFYSLLALGYIFILSLIAAVWIYDLVRQKKPNIHFAVGVAVALAAIMMVEHQLIISMISSDQGFVSHRVEFVHDIPDALSALNTSRVNFKYGQEHVPSLQSKIILPGIGLVLLTLLLRGAISIYRMGLPKPKRLSTVFTCLTDTISASNRHSFALLLALLVGSLLISLWYGYWWHIWGALKTLFPHMAYFNLSRFHYLHPLFWYVMFGLVLSTFWNHFPKLGKPIAVILILLQVLYLFSKSEERRERVALKPTYEQFFSADLFKDIENFIGRDKRDYRVCSVGLYPSIASFNGFFTLDGYSAHYPLEHKRKFRQIVAKELQKSEFYRDYFDSWGGRYYIFSSELKKLGTDEFLLTKETVSKYRAKITEFGFNTKAFKSMGGDYVFSAVSIENAEEIDLVLLKVFENESSPWRIFLYQVKFAHRLRQTE